MATKSMAKVVRKAKGVAENIYQPPFLRCTIPAQQARPAPPLGPQLGKPDRSYKLITHIPPPSHLLRLAVGASKGAAESGHEVCGRLSLKHIYHIAELYLQDPWYKTERLESMCRKLIGMSHRLGIDVVDPKEASSSDYTPEGYALFLQERQQFLADRKKQLEESKQTKMLRLT